MTRLLLACLFLFACGKSFSQPIFDPALDALMPANEAFPFGVASGDPQADGAVIWTKIFTKNTDGQQVAWEVATDTALQDVVRSGTLMAKFADAYSVKIFVEGLQPGTTYFFRFKFGESHSPIGRTRTAPAGEVAQLRFAVVSCSDYRSGYFNAYGDIARRSDIDAVIHLGDYIYEYGNQKWGPKRQQKTQVRDHIPAHTLHSLQDYRTRYALHRLDPQLQELHRLHPMIAVWDDHEIANDLNASFDDQAREAAARQAYFEWMPVRDNPERSIVRHFNFGNLAEMWMLDSRLEGRSPQAKGVDDPDLASPDRHMLGEAQTDWLLEGIGASKASWKIIGNQVIFSPLHDSRVFSRTPKVRMDRWDGYPVERQRIFDFFHENDIQNIVVLTGDVHTSWAFELTADPLNPDVYDRKTGKGVVGAEFVTPSVTSFNFNEVLPGIVAKEAKRRFKHCKYNPHLRYLDLTHHGYLTLTLTAEAATADWYFVKRKDRPDDRVKRRAGRTMLYDGKKLTKKQKK